MNDATQPAAAVESLSEDALVGQLESQFGVQAPEKKPQQEAEEVTQPDQPSDGEPTPEDLQSEEDEPPKQEAADGEEEIIHNGQPVKVSREELKSLAQKGFDYDRKTQALAEERKYVGAAIQRVQMLEQVAPQLHQERAVVEALGQRLQAVQNQDWARLAAEDPLEFPKAQAELMQIQQAYNQAAAQYQARVGAFEQERQNVAAMRLHTEAQQMVARIPAWQDTAKREAETREIRSYLTKKGVAEEVVNSISEAVLVDIARDAWLYSQLKTIKTDRSKQLRQAPPVVKPGANAPQDQGKASYAKTTRAIREAGRQGNHHAQQKLMEGLLSKVWK